MCHVAASGGSAGPEGVGRPGKRENSAKEESNGKKGRVSEGLAVRPRMTVEVLRNVIRRPGTGATCKEESKTDTQRTAGRQVGRLSAVGTARNLNS